MRSKIVTGMLMVLSLGLFGVVAPAAHAGTAQTFGVKVDAQAVDHEPWAFLHFYPHIIKVHAGDTIDAQWAGSDTPHTATFVNTDDPEQWRQDNQGPGGPFELIVPDSQVGGDDNEVVINPSVLFPSDPSCGVPGNPCAFDGSSVVTSGLQFPAPGGTQPSFSVTVNASVGDYSLLCLLHPGMEIPVRVLPASQPVPSPDAVRALAHHEVAVANRVDGPTADAQAQQVLAQDIGNGHTLWTISAGGFSNNVSANEYVNSGLKVRVNDQIQVNGNFEIHTATFPRTAIKTVPFIKTQCEVPGKDIPAQSPFDCQDPSQFQAAFGNKAITPSQINRLRDPTEFINSGLLTPGVNGTFIAKKPGTYTMICLVHGPEMQTTVTIEP
jgi:plastocyanin